MADATSTTQWGPWIISGLALAQVWVIGLLKKLRKPHVDLYESGNVEVGYSGFGPTIGLMGTMRGLHKDVFIQRITATLTKLKDKSVHTFNWRAFRPNTFSLNPAEPPRFEVAASFLLSCNNPFKYNIFFVDESFTAEIAPKVGEVSKSWLDFRTTRLRELKNQYEDNFKLLLGNPMLDQTLYDEFFKSGTLTNAFTILERACYWEPADYTLSVHVEAAKPNRIFTKEISFFLSEDDVKLLHLNTIAILRTLCGFNAQFNFASPEYKK
ncbi:MAG: hypothetical protein AB7T27_05910 [Kiritimatiellia bacterium]